jgi:hypothetical protein
MCARYIAAEGICTDIIGDLRKDLQGEFECVLYFIFFNF